MSKIPTQEPDAKELVFNLYNELQAAKKDKKATVKGHNENIKRIEDELKDVLDQEEQDIKSDQSSVIR